MKKILAGTISSIIAIAIIVIAIVMFYNNGDRGIREKKLSDYQEIIKISESEDYLSTPTNVVNLYCKIEKLIYSTNFEKEKNKDVMIDKLLNLQISLLDDELIQYNGGADFIKIKTINSANEFLEKGFKIIDTKTQTSSSINTDEKGNVVKFVNVIQYINKGDNSYKMYGLRQDSKGKWKILTFADIEEFTLS